MFWSLREKKLQRGKDDQLLMITEGEGKDLAVGFSKWKSQATLRRGGKVPPSWNLILVTDVDS